MVDDRLVDLRAQLAAARQTWNQDGQVVLATGLEYATNDPVLIRVAKRGRRYDISDDGAALARAGKPNGWLEISGRLLHPEGFNLNRRGVVFVPAVEGRDLAALVLRLAEASRDVCLTLLEVAS